MRKRISMDGNQAAAYISYPFTEVAVIYPITPSSPMPEHVDNWASAGKENMFGKPVQITEMQNEKGAAGALHGSALTGSLSTTYTSSQGLLLMIPNMYKIAGERLPAVMHVATRALSAVSLNMYGDHQDVMATRATGFVMFCSGSVQEVMDLGPVAHLSAIEGRLPFMHFFEGFRTSHEIQKIETWEYEDLINMVDMEAIQRMRERAFTPDEPTTHGIFEKEGYMQRVESANLAYENIVDIVEGNINKINEKIGTNYGLFDYYGDPEATDVVVAMGSVTSTLEETVDELREKEGRKVGLLKVHLFRPFSVKHMLDKMPKTVERIAVLDRTKEKGAPGEPLYLDVVAAYNEVDESPRIIRGRYGIGQKDTTPAMLAAVYDNLREEKPKREFTLGIKDDVTHLSLEPRDGFIIKDPTMVRCKFWGNGGDGTVGANKSAITIIGDNTDKYVQGYFDYDAKKSNGLTVSHLRFSEKPINSAYLVDQSDFISCSPQAYIFMYDLLKGLKKGGTFLLNTIWSDEELNEHLPASMKRYLAENEIEFYTINATAVAEEVGLGNRTNMVIQTAFFKLANILPIDQAISLLKDSILESYGNKGEDVVNMNNRAVDLSLDRLHKVDVPADWAQAEDEPVVRDEPDFYKEMVRPVLELKDDELPVSSYLPYDDGRYITGTTHIEKRGIATYIPEWQPENCIQCNLCSVSCPHGVIRPYLLTDEEKANAPEGFETIEAIGKGVEGYNFRIQLSPLDCTGCGNCADICPAKEKALVMKPLQEQGPKQKDLWEYAHEVVGYKDDLVEPTTVKNTQFKQPLLEFSGACNGCGETPYAKLITQLYGDHMYITNAAGCSSVWGCSLPSVPYTMNAEGKGPAWAHSLFEDNAEFGYGVMLAEKSNRNQLAVEMDKFMAAKVANPLNDLFQEWLDNMGSHEETKRLEKEIKKYLYDKTDNAEADEALKNIQSLSNFLIKKSVWLFGGDGWAYDIDFDGIDHVLASGENINIFVFDTEVYSNTGGQSSKSTPIAAVAKFAASGKRVRKKDLGLMMSSYGYIYVAQVALGANQQQTLKAIREAEAYNGPSLVIGYSPCINHGLKAGMGKTQRREKEAVDAGYWHLWRFNPELREQGKNPFVLDSKEPTADFQEFLQGEVRYASLQSAFPEEASELYADAELAARERYEAYLRMADQA